MIIRNAEKAGVVLENEFVAVDSLETRLGRCVVEPVMNGHLMPERPLEIKITATGKNEAKQQLLAAATARAMVIARAQPDVRARIWAQCGTRNRVLNDLLASLGFDSDDAMVRMRRRIVRGGNTAPRPEGCVFIEDRLDDPAERGFFLERADQLFRLPDPEAWLKTAAAKPAFRRLLLTARSGLAGELVCWSETARTGVIGLVYTTPSWRGRGVATHLMEAARQHFSRQGVYEAVFDVRWRMTPAVRLAATAGYRRSETLYRMPGIDL